LLEIIIVMSIIAMFVGAAASFAIKRENEEMLTLDREFRVLATTVKDTALSETKTQYIIFTHKGIWQANSPDEEFDPSKPHLPVSPEIKLAIRYDEEWLAIDKNSDPQSWLFSASGICEPISLRIEAEDAITEYDFHPLTAKIIFGEEE